MNKSFFDNFKKYSALALLIAVFSVSTATLVFAADPTKEVNTGAKTATPTQTPQSTFTLQNPLKVNSVGGLIQNFVVIFSYVVILFAVLALIWVGLQFILARGDVAKMKELKEWLLWIVVGVAVVIGARLIIQVVINTLSATGAIDQGIINSTDNALRGR